MKDWKEDYYEDIDYNLPEYKLPEQVEMLIETGKYDKVEHRITKVRQWLPCIMWSVYMANSTCNNIHVS